MSDPLLVHCGTHGSMPARFIICKDCHTTFDMEDDETLGEICTCGSQLLPPKDGGKEFSARLICAPCHFKMKSPAEA